MHRAGVGDEGAACHAQVDRGSRLVCVRAEGSSASCAKVCSRDETCMSMRCIPLPGTDGLAGTCGPADLEPCCITGTDNCTCYDECIAEGYPAGCMLDGRDLCCFESLDDYNRPVCVCIPLDILNSGVPAFVETQVEVTGRPATVVSGCGTQVGE